MALFIIIKYIPLTPTKSVFLFLDVEHLILSLDKIRKKSYTVYRKGKGKKKNG